jgi:hypothetical protein
MQDSNSLNLPYVVSSVKSIVYLCAVRVCFVAVAYQTAVTTARARNGPSLAAVLHFSVGKTGNYKSCSSHIAVEQENTRSL